MRPVIIAVICMLTVLWAFDAYENDGRYSHDLWQHGMAEGQYYSSQVQHWVNRTLSGS